MITPRIFALLVLLPVLYAADPLPEVTPPAPEPVETPAPVPTPTPLPSLDDWINSLDDAQVQNALELLETQFQGAEELDASVKQRALLQGLTTRLAPGVGIGVGTHDSTTPPFLAEILDARAGYIRPGSLDATALTQMDAALEKFSGKQVPALILDLRGLRSGEDLETAAKFARRLTPKGKILFTIQKPSAKQERILTSDTDPLFAGILLVLVDADTAGASEVLAATLREHAGAMLLGETTAGEAVEFVEFPLGGDKALRLAVSRVVLPVGGVVFPQGVSPEVPVPLDSGVRDRIFELGQKGGVSRFVFDVERPRVNEAALVANRNPEISAPVKNDESSASPRDPVLQRAMDLVTAILFYKK
jgi:hypothetical protein